MKATILKFTQKVLSILSGLVFVAFILFFSTTIDIPAMLGIPPLVSVGIGAGVILLMGLVTWAQDSLDSSDSGKR
jgi:hypothetical protein